MQSGWWRLESKIRGWRSLVHCGQGGHTSAEWDGGSNAVPTAPATSQSVSWVDSGANDKKLSPSDSPPHS
jgi:hypothetical protein